MGSVILPIKLVILRTLPLDILTLFKHNTIEITNNNATKEKSERASMRLQDKF